MQVWRDDSDLGAPLPADFGRSVVTIGVFDGVHRGHQQIVNRALARAAELRLPAVGVTFDPLPESVIRPDAHPALLTTLDRRLELLAGLGLDATCVLHFTPDFASRSPEEFVRTVLVGRLRVVDVVVGANFRFGRRAAGDVALLTALGSQYGYMVDAVELVRPTGANDPTANDPTGDDSGGVPVFSSSWIRERISAGDVEGAAEALGRPHRLVGTVVHGDHRGRELGYPTANLELPPLLAVPADGVYAGLLDGMPAAISVGTNPTFDGTQRRVEAYVIDGVGLDLYGRQMVLDLVARVRPMTRFDDVEALVVQMGRDVMRCRELLR